MWWQVPRALSLQSTVDELLVTRRDEPGFLASPEEALRVGSKLVLVRFLVSIGHWYVSASIFDT